MVASGIWIVVSYRRLTASSGLARAYEDRQLGHERDDEPASTALAETKQSLSLSDAAQAVHRLGYQSNGDASGFVFHDPQGV
jgi:hypothetical protein